MPQLPLGWRTDLDVLERSGAVFERGGDHLIVRSPDNPGFHWGNFLMVTSPQLAGQPQRCLAILHEALHGARHVAVGLPVPSARAWQDSGVPYEWDLVLASTQPPARGAAPAGYSVRQLHSADDWSRCVRADMAEHVRTGGSADDGYLGFAQASNTSPPRPRPAAGWRSGSRSATTTGDTPRSECSPRSPTSTPWPTAALNNPRRSRHERPDSAHQP